ncbi:MAG: hypothetical protein U1D96_05500 [Eubacteriales bacterium]|nr:hypothetical protein [Clostridia bacterium]MDZ4042936.1 hypothetical protein [Eubacteriales bacterium]MDZ7610275.1 hypothetical protein [Eubacteriales bacterium]
MIDLLSQIPAQWQENQGRILEIGDKVAEAVRPQFLSESRGDLDSEILHKAWMTERPFSKDSACSQPTTELSEVQQVVKS